MMLARGRDFPGQFLQGTHHSCPSYKLQLDLVGGEDTDVQRLRGLGAAGRTVCERRVLSGSPSLP